MDFLSSKRLVTTALVILVVLNVTLLGFLWWQNTHKPEYRLLSVKRQITKPVYFGPELTLTQAQQERFATLRRQHFRQTLPEVRQIVALKKELVNEAVKDNPDSIRIAGIADQIGKRQAILERSLAMHFHELAAVCAPGAQRDSLKMMLETVYSRKYERGKPWGGARIPNEHVSNPPGKLRLPIPSTNP
jgi:hypothetical protein